jgi:hypothetical protein
MFGIRSGVILNTWNAERTSDTRAGEIPVAAQVCVSRLERGNTHVKVAKSVVKQKMEYFMVVLLSANVTTRRMFLALLVRSEERRAIHLFGFRSKVIRLYVVVAQPSKELTTSSSDHVLGMVELSGRVILHQSVVGFLISIQRLGS